MTFRADISDKSGKLMPRRYLPKVHTSDVVFVTFLVFQETRACVIAALVLSCLVVLLQLVNIYVRNSCLVKANIGFNSLAGESFHLEQ